MKTPPAASQPMPDGFVPLRWVELSSLDPEFMLLELEKLPDYGFTGVTLWTSFSWPRSSLIDNYYYTLPLVYRRHGDLNLLRDQEMIRRGADFLREFTRRAHRLGLTVQQGYHLCNFVGERMDVGAQLRNRDLKTGLERLRPEWFNQEGEPEYSSPGFYDFMATEVDEFFTAFPQVDGLFCWNCECSTYTPSRLRHQSLPKAEIAARAMRAVYDVCIRRGKMMTHDIHTAGADTELTRGIIDAAAEMPDLILGADATYSDWHMLLPTTPWLGEMRRHNRIYVGFDASGEFFGQGRTVGGWPRWITKHFAAVKVHGLSAVSVRNNTIAKDNSCLLVPMLELNLRLVANLARHGEVDLDTELADWWQRHFQGTLPEGMREVLLSFEDYIEKALYINGCNITEYNPDHGFSRKAVNVAPGYPVWHAEQFFRPGTPIVESMCRMIPLWGHQSRPVEELRQEKLDAIAICNRALTKIASMVMAPEDRVYFETKISQARDFANAYLLTIEVIHPLYQIVGEHYDTTMTDPRAVLHAALQRFREFTAQLEARWGPEFYRDMPPKMRAFADDIPPSLYLDGTTEPSLH